jgi:hypothetical protein
MQAWRGVWVGILALGAACMLALNTHASAQHSAGRAELKDWDYDDPHPSGSENSATMDSAFNATPSNAARRFQPYCGGPRPVGSCVNEIIRIDRELKEREANFRKTGQGYNAGLSLTGCYSYCVLRHFPHETPQHCAASVPGFRRAAQKAPGLWKTDLHDLLAEACGLASLLPRPRARTDSLGRAGAVIREHRLLSSRELACSFLEEDGSSKERVRVNVREKHNKFCGGDPSIAPRRFTLEIDLKTGTAFWDYNGEMELRPVPNTRASERTLR